jgi:biotin carboxylase
MGRQKAIWLFAGGQMQESAAKKILDLGYELILTDMNPGCVCAKYASDFVQCDTFDIEGNKKAAQELRKRYVISAGVTLAADCHETVAHINKLLGLPGISPQIAHVCRQKNLTRAALTAAGIPQPKFAFVRSLAEAKVFLQSLAGKGVIKATDNSGSRGFSKIDSHAELTAEKFDVAIRSGTSGAVLVEEALQPREDCIAELSVETLWFNGRMYWLNWVDRLFRSDWKFFPSLAKRDADPVNWAVEIGHINPACHPGQLKARIREVLHAAGLAIGMDKEVGGHVLKGDIMLTDDGPMILELTPRLSGGWDSSGTTPARGADFQGGMIRLALGEPLDLDLWHSHFEFGEPNLYASILADIPVGAKDCIGRQFAVGVDFERETSLQLALNNIRENRYVVSMV